MPAGKAPVRREQLQVERQGQGRLAHLRVVLVPISPRWFSASSLMLIPSVWARILMIFWRERTMVTVNDLKHPIYKVL